MWVSSTRDGKTQLGPVQWSLRELNNGPKQIKDLLKGHHASCLKMNQ
jgi:hypothetical protein